MYGKEHRIIRACVLETLFNIIEKICTIARKNATTKTCVKYNDNATYFKIHFISFCFSRSVCYNDSLLKPPLTIFSEALLGDNFSSGWI